MQVRAFNIVSRAVFNQEDDGVVVAQTVEHNADNEIVTVTDRIGRVYNYGYNDQVEVVGLFAGDFNDVEDTDFGV